MSDARKKLWEPSEEWIKNAEVTRFIEYINTEYGLNIRTGKELYRWSVDKITDFWAAMWKFSGMIASKQYDKVVEDINVFPGTKWFPGSMLNFAENLLKYKDDQLAFIFH